MGLSEQARVVGEVSLRKSLRSGTRRSQGEIERVYFRFARHGIFLEHGVGRGRPVGSAKAERLKRPWLSVVLPDEIDALADTLSEEYADVAANELRFLIPGIIDTRVGGMKNKTIDTTTADGSPAKIVIDPSFF